MFRRGRGFDRQVRLVFEGFKTSKVCSHIWAAREAAKDIARDTGYLGPFDVEEWDEAKREWVPAKGKEFTLDARNL